MKYSVAPVRGRAVADWGIKVAAFGARAGGRGEGGGLAALRIYQQAEHELLKNCAERLEHAPCSPNLRYIQIRCDVIMRLHKDNADNTRRY